MENKKITTVVGVVILVIIVITVFYFIQKAKETSAPNPTSTSTPAPVTTQAEKTKPTEGEVAAVTGAETDALTGEVKLISSDSITVKNDEREITVALYKNIDTYSIDQKTGLVIRNISEVKSGMRVTVDFNVGSKMARYVVIEP